MEVKIEIIKGVEGLCVAINDYRVCGSKPWGGGKIIAKWKVSLNDLNLRQQFYKEFSAKVMEKAKDAGEEIFREYYTPLYPKDKPISEMTPCEQGLYKNTITICRIIHDKVIKILGELEKNALR